MKTQHFSGSKRQETCSKKKKKKERRKKEIACLYLFHVPLRKTVFASFHEKRQCGGERRRCLMPPPFCFNSGAPESTRRFTELINWKTVVENQVMWHDSLCTGFAMNLCKSTPVCLFIPRDKRPSMAAAPNSCCLMKTWWRRSPVISDLGPMFSCFYRCLTLWVWFAVLLECPRMVLNKWGGMIEGETSAALNK